MTLWIFIDIESVAYRQMNTAVRLLLRVDQTSQLLASVVSDAFDPFVTSGRLWREKINLLWVRDGSWYVINLLTYLLTYLPTFLLTRLLTYLITYYLLIYLLTYLPTLLLTYLLAYLLTYLLTYLPSHLLTYLLTYLLTPCSRVLLEKLTGLQIVKKFPAFYGTQRLSV
jgi:hypothetical protein